MKSQRNDRGALYFAWTHSLTNCLEQWILFLFTIFFSLLCLHPPSLCLLQRETTWPHIHPHIKSLRKIKLKISFTSHFEINEKTGEKVMDLKEHRNDFLLIFLANSIRGAAEERKTNVFGRARTASAATQRAASS